MKSASDDLARQRPYRQRARALAVEATRRRIVDVFAACMRVQWYDEIKLEQVAGQAHVTVRTIIRRFGSKEGLLQAFVDDFVSTVRVSRDGHAGDVDGAVRHIAGIYEEWGDSVIRNLAQEERHPALRRWLDLGRENHRAVTAQVFAPWLDAVAPDERTALLDALVLATDVYAWKLVRRDMGRTPEDTHRLMRRLVDAVLVQASSHASVTGDK